MSSETEQKQKLEILNWDDKCMLTPCTNVTLLDDESFDAVENLVTEMRELCAQRKGLGLSANQIGKSLRMFIMRTSINDDFEVCINPTIVRHGKDTVVSREGCLSAPDNPQVKLRWRVIDVSYLSGHGLVTKTLKGTAAIVYQHEYSHICGIPFVMEKKEPVTEKAV